MSFLIPERSPPNRAPTKRDAPFPELSQLSLKIPRQWTPQFPQRASTERQTPVSRAFFYTFPSKSPVNDPPPPCSPTGSLWREKFHLQSQWFVPSFNGENIWSLSTESNADGRPAYNGVRPGSRRESSETLQSLPQCHAAFSTIPSTLAWVDQSPVSKRVP